MTVSEIILHLEALAPRSLQESYDNAQLICGSPSQAVSRALVCLDCTEAVVEEAIANECNMIIAHHPIVFGGLKSLTGKNYVERVLIKAIKHDVAIHAVHTNLDHVWNGVNRGIGERLGLQQLRMLAPKKGMLKKLFTFVPATHAEAVRQAMFDAGAGHIGEYDHCSYNSAGTGTFRGSDLSKPFVGEPGKEHHEAETKVEVIVPGYAMTPVVDALRLAHPYEEVAYDIVPLENVHPRIGSGMIGKLEIPMSGDDFLRHLARQMKTPVIRHTPLLHRPVEWVAFCGGAGSFLLEEALAQKADVYITGDFKYHQFFDADGKIVVMDIGHFESEQFTPALIKEYLEQKIPTFAILLSEVNTNPVHYFIS